MVIWQGIARTIVIVGDLDTLLKNVEPEKFNQKQAKATVYALMQREVEAGTFKVVAGQISIVRISAYTLIDSGASQSFVSTNFVKKLDMVPDLLDDVYIVSLLSGQNLTSQFGFKDVPVKITGRELPVNLMVLDMVDYNLILGMEWLSKYNATTFRRRKKVVFQPLKEKFSSIKARLEEVNSQ